MNGKDRVPTGVPGLDFILYGGLISGYSYLITGEPGCGKTVLSNQICFHAAQQGYTTIYITLLSEQTTKLAQDMSGFEFYEPAFLGEKVQYFHGSSILAESGLAGLLDMVRDSMQRLKPRLVVLDGFTATTRSVDFQCKSEHFLSELNALANTMRCTVLVVQPNFGEQLKSREGVTVDGVIELHHSLIGARTIRDFQISKFRGSGFVEGMHVFTIDEQGVRIFPRSEYRLAAANPKQTGVAQSTGIGALDEMLRGGFRSASSTVVLGPPGSGKTTLALHFVAEAVARSENALFCGFYETAEQLRFKAENIGLRLPPERLTIIWNAAVDWLLDRFIEQLLNTIEKERPQRIVIDGVRAIQQLAVYPERLPRVLRALINDLSSRGITTLLACENQRILFDEPDLTVQDVSTIVDNLICLRYAEMDRELRRTVSIVKQRQGDFDTHSREFKITDSGIEISGGT